MARTGDSEATARRELPAAIALLALSTIFGLMLAEALARALTPAIPVRQYVRGGGFALDCYSDNPRGYFELDLRQESVRHRLMLRLGHDLDEVARVAPFCVRSRYNRLDYRGADFPLPAAGRRRLVLVGDSFTEGQGVREADTTAAVLRGLLGDGVGWDVLNCGRRGNEAHDVEAALDTILEQRPDVIVYLMVLNDVDRSAAFEAEQPFLNDWILDRTGARGVRAHPGPSFLMYWAKARIESWRVAEATTRWYQGMYGPSNRAGWERTQMRIRSMRDRAQRRGVGFGVALWPLLVDLDDYPFELVHSEIASACMRARIPFLDLRDGLRGPPMRALWVHELDHHPNELAHRLVAQQMQPWLTTLLPAH